MVAGIINQKAVNEAINDVHFVAYEVIKPVLKPSNQMSFLQTQDIETVLHLCTSKTPTKSADLSDKGNSYHALEKCEGVKQ